MEVMTANVYFEEANRKLKQASEELYRPEEDVVTYLVCQNSHLAIENFLKGFLVKNQIGFDNLSSVDELYSKCKSVNGKFEQLDLEGHSFESHADDKYCNSKVSRCYELANNLDNFLRKEEIIG